MTVHIRKLFTPNENRRKRYRRQISNVERATSRLFDALDEEGLSVQD